MADDNRYLLRLDNEDWALLLKICELEKLNKSDVLRRSLRSYSPKALEEAKRVQASQKRLLELEAATAEDGDGT